MDSPVHDRIFPYSIVCQPRAANPCMAKPMPRICSSLMRPGHNCSYFATCSLRHCLGEIPYTFLNALEKCSWFG